MTYEELKNKLNYYRDKYYNENISEVSDREYDELFDQLEAMEIAMGRADNNSATQSVGYEVKSELSEVTHDHPLLSLAKTKSSNDIKTKYQGYDVMVSSKMDGLTVSLKYRDGQLVSAETRGNGIVGEDILHNAKTFTNIPLSLPIKDEIVIDGEAIIDYDTFKQFESEGYKNPRNLVSGSVRRLDSKICADRKVKFIAWKLYRGQGYETKYDRAFDYLTLLGFEVVEHKIVHANELDKIDDVIDIVRNNTIKKNYPIDGVVICYNDAVYGESLGVVGNHPRYGLAYKFYNDEVETILRDIEWTTSRTGLVNPVAIFDPVELYGTTVTRASLSNLSIIEELELGIGDTILVTKANEIIPQVTDNLTRSNSLIIPTHCPSCGNPLTIKNAHGRKTMMCESDDCFAKLCDKISLFTSKIALDIQGLSDETIKTLIDNNLLTCRIDLFFLKDKINDIVTIEGFGKTKVNKLLNAIESSKNTTFEKFIVGMGIPHIGVQNAKQIFAFLKDRQNRTDITSDFITLASESFKWSLIEGIGKKMESDINTFVEKNFDEMCAIRDMLTMDYGNDVSSVTSNSSINGMSFCITGKLSRFPNRNALVSNIESDGGKVVNSVTKMTNYLITNDKNSGSSKNKSAEKYGTKIISEDEYLSMREGRVVK